MVGGLADPRICGVRFLRLPSYPELAPRAGGIVLLAGLGTSPSLFTWLPPDDGTLGGSCRVSGPQLHGFLAPASSKMWVTPSHCGLL